MRKKKGSNRHKQPRESFHLPEELREALDDYRESTKPTPGKSEVLRTALEEFLKRLSFWPPRPRPKP